MARFEVPHPRRTLRRARPRRAGAVPRLDERDQHLGRRHPPSSWSPIMWRRSCPASPTSSSSAPARPRPGRKGGCPHQPGPQPALRSPGEAHPERRQIHPARALRLGHSRCSLGNPGTQPGFIVPEADQDDKALVPTAALLFTLDGKNNCTPMTEWDRRILAAQGYVELGLHDEARAELAPLPPKEQNRVDVIEVTVLCHMNDHCWGRRWRWRRSSAGWSLMSRAGSSTRLLPA
jgi:hypothetical protein